MRRLGILALATFLSLGALPGWAEPMDLTILHTNDTHDHLAPFDTRDAKDLGGIARRATLIAQIKKTHPRVLVLDAGDTFQGTPLFNFFSGKADYDTLDQAGYDATTVGNHDLDNGLLNLEKQDAHRHFKLISTNLLDPKTGKPIFYGSQVFEREGLRVGVFGVLGDDALLAVAEKNRRGFRFVSPYAIAEKTAAELHKHADLVVMLSHSGLQEDLDLASKIKGIDVIVGGHSHTKVDHPKVVTNGDWKTLVVQAYQWGEYMGELDLKVDHGTITSFDGNLLPITRALAPDPKIEATVTRYSDQIAKRMNVVIGEAPKGLSQDDKYARDCELGDWTADLMRDRAHAEIGIMNAGGLRSPLLPGPVTVGAIFSIFPFDNALVTVDLDGSTIQQLLDRSASAPGKAGALQYSGLKFRVDGAHATNVEVDGAPLDPARHYRVVTIDYLAQGNDGFTPFTKGTHYHALGMLLRDTILEAVKTHPEVLPPATGRIQAN